MQKRNRWWERLSNDEKMAYELMKARTNYEKLLVAASYGNLPLVQEYVNQNTPVNLPDLLFDATPLYYAACGGHLTVVAYLIAQGADVNQGSRRNLDNTPLNIALSQAHLAVAKYLIKKGANVNHVTYWGTSALGEVLWHAKLHTPEFTEQALNLLIANGVLLDTPNSSAEAKFAKTKADILQWSPLSANEQESRIAVLEKTLLAPKPWSAKAMTPARLLLKYTPLYNSPAGAPTEIADFAWLDPDSLPDISPDTSSNCIDEPEQKSMCRIM